MTKPLVGPLATPYPLSHIQNYSASLIKTLLIDFPYTGDHKYCHRMHSAMPKSLKTVLVIFFTFLQVVLGNFDLYRVKGWDEVGDEPLDGYQVYNYEPQCYQITRMVGWKPSKDLSHGRIGIRCVGKCGIDDVSRNPSYVHIIGNVNSPTTAPMARR